MKILVIGFLAVMTKHPHKEQNVISTGTEELPYGYWSGINPAFKLYDAIPALHLHKKMSFSSWAS